MTTASAVVLTTTGSSQSHQRGTQTALEWSGGMFWRHKALRTEPKARRSPGLPAMESATDWTEGSKNEETCAL